jgi:hypothetical protein
MPLVRCGRAIAAIAASVGALLLAAPVGASPPTEGSGVGTIAVREITESRQADGNTIQVRHTEGTLTGAFDGTYEQTVRGVIHKDGIVTFHGVMTFTGQAADCGTGTVDVEFEGKAIAGVPVAEGRLRTIDQGTNTLKVHVIGAFDEFATFFTYEGEFHCD